MSEIKHSKTPWEMNFQKDEHGVQCAVLFDADGKAIADGFNSIVICIFEEADEDGVSRWDEQGRVDFEFICLAVNSFEPDQDRIRRLEEALLSPYCGLLVLKTMLRKLGLEAGVKVANEALAELVALHPALPALSALRHSSALGGKS